MIIEPVQTYPRFGKICSQSDREVSKFIPAYGEEAPDVGDLNWKVAAWVELVTLQVGSLLTVLVGNGSVAHI